MSNVGTGSRPCRSIFQSLRLNWGHRHFGNSARSNCNFVRRFSRSLAVEPVSLSYKEYGDANSTENDRLPTLMTHGLLGSQQNWTSIARIVAKSTKRRVITFDARNHGTSPRSPIHNYGVMASDILELANSLGLEKFSLLGHSMGGRSVMVFALENPERLENLIVVDVSPLSMSQAFRPMKNFIEALMSIQLDSSQTLSEGRKIADQKLTSVTDDPDLRAFLLTNLSKTRNVSGNGEFSWKPNLPVLLNRVAELQEFPSHLLDRQFNLPAIFIRGGNSHYIPDSDINGIKKIFTQAKIETIAGSGHWPQVDNPNQFIPILVKFLNQNFKS